MFIKKNISEEGTIGRWHSEIQINHVFLFICDKHCWGKVICHHDHFIWCGTEVGEVREVGRISSCLVNQAVQTFDLFPE